VNLVFAYPGEIAPVLPSFLGERWVQLPGRRPLGRHCMVSRHDP
jgi:hypothetical protein